MADFISKYTGEEIEARLDKVPELEAGKASLWDSEKQYAKGDFCVHKGYLWVCTAETGNTGTEPSTNYNVWNVTYSNPNLLDNPWFTVNQRGQSSYNINSAYTVDRWKIDNSGVSENVLTINSDGSITFSVKSGYNLIFQSSTKEFYDSLNGEICTISVLYDDGIIETHTHEMFSGVTKTTSRVSMSSIYVAEYSSIQSARIEAKADGVTIRAIKLELGSVSTLANDVAPDYATELLKCQRYYQKDSLHTTGSTISGTYAVNTFLKANMRIVPTVTITECAYWNGTNWLPISYNIIDQLESNGYFSCWVNGLPTNTQVNIIIRYSVSADL